MDVITVLLTEVAFSAELMSKFAMTLDFTPYHGGSRACEGGEERRGKPGGLSPKPRLTSRGTGFTSGG